jgi:hypothetical protein
MDIFHFLVLFYNFSIQCRSVLDMIEDNNNIVKCSLSSMGLPGALFVHDKMEDIPQEMKLKIESMRGERRDKNISLLSHSLIQRSS